MTRILEYVKINIMQEAEYKIVQTLQNGGKAMNNKEFFRRVLSSRKRNVRHFLEMYFCKEAEIRVGKSEKITIGGKKRKAFLVQIIIQNSEIKGYVLPERLNGFILFVPEKEKAIRFTVRDRVNVDKEGCPIEKRAKVEHFQRDNWRGRYFEGTLGRYLKEKTTWAWC